MGCQEVQLIKARSKFRVRSISFLYLTLPIPSLFQLLLFTHQYRLDMSTTPSIYPKPEGEQDCGLHSHRSFDDDGVYPNILQEFTHFPDDYDRDPSATVNMLSLIDENLPSSRMDNVPLNALPEPLDLEPHLTLGLLNNQDVLVNGATEGPSPPPPMKPFGDVYDSLSTMVSLGSSPEPPLHIFTTDQVRTYTSRQQFAFNVVYIARVFLGFASITTP